MTLNQPLGNGLDVSSGLGLRLLLHWRIRCAARRVPMDATSGPDAAKLCTSVIRTLQSESNAGDLEYHLRRWRSGAATAEARGALLCLAELTSELSAEVFDVFPPPGLAVILEHLSNAAAAAAMPEKPVSRVEPLTGCPGSDALERDLEKMVRRAVVSSADLGVAVVELDQRRRHRKPPASAPDGPNDAIVSLASTLRMATSQADAVYRWGARRFAIVSWDADKVAMRQAMLQAVCLGGVKLHWGVASLSDVGSPAEQSPDLLLMMAEADLHLRRKDMSHAKAALERRRRTSVVGVGAAAMLLAAALSTGLSGAPGQPGGGVSAERHVFTPTTVAPQPAATNSTSPPAATQAPASSINVSAGSSMPAATTVALIRTAPVNPTPTPRPTPTPPPPPPPPTPKTGHGPGGIGPPGHSKLAPGALKKLAGVLHKA